MKYREALARFTQGKYAGLGDRGRRMNATEVLNTLIPMARNTDDVDHRFVQRCGGTPVETFDDPQEYAIQSEVIDESTRLKGK